MTAFIIFWAAAFAIIFFILGIIFKTLASAFNALKSSAEILLSVGALAVLAVIALYSLYSIIQKIIADGFGAALGSIMLYIVIFAIVGAFLFEVGAIILGIAVFVVGAMVTLISAVLEKTAGLCETVYAKNLLLIMKQLNISDRR